MIAAEMENLSLGVERCSKIPSVTWCADEEKYVGKKEKGTST
jgi:hypothetical protein